MGLYNVLGIDEGMNREQVEKQLFSARKKWSLRQNGSDLQKRQEAETILDVTSSLQNAINKSVDDASPGVQLLVRSYGCLYDNGMLNNDAKADIEAAASGSGDKAGQLAEFFGEIGREDIQKPWVFWSADCGYVEAYQECGFWSLMDSDPDTAIKWFEKAEQANAIEGHNLYNWGLTYGKKGLYIQAKEKFEKAVARGDMEAPYILGKMYECGEGIPRDLEMALRQYRLAQQRGRQEVQADITRVTNLLQQQKIQQQKIQQQNKPAGQPIAVQEIESDKKSAVPNLEDIIIDSLKDSFKEKVNIDELKEKAENLAENVDTERIRKLPWKKIIIVIVICWLASSALRSCAARLFLSEGKKTSDKKVQEMTQMSEETEETENKEVEEEEKGESVKKAVTDDTDATPASSFTYEIREEGVRITAFTGNETEVIVPAVIERKPVYEIYSGAFRDNRALTAVTLKEGIVTIEREAFSGCSYLLSVTLPDSLERIESSAFRECSSLQSVTLPASIAYVGDSAFAKNVCLNELVFTEGRKDAEIGDDAFNGCKSLTSLYLPGNVIKIGRGAFGGCESIRELTIIGNNAVIASSAFAGCKSLQSLIIHSAEEIEREAFKECVSLQNAVLPEGLTSIGDNAFGGCKNLITVALPSSIQRIGDSAFAGDTSISSVTFGKGDSDASLGSDVFDGCIGITAIDLPGNYLSIGRGAFRNCSGMVSFKWGDSGVAYANQSLGGGALQNCSSLSSITLSPNLESIGNAAFSKCTSLQSINIPEGVTKIDSEAFRDCSGLSVVTIPGTVEVIGDSSFMNDSALKEVTIMEGRADARIGRSAFNKCSSLERMEIPGNYVEIGSDAFAGCGSLRVLQWSESGAVFENQTLGSRVFSECNNLTDVYLSKNLGSIGGDVFRQCDNVTIRTASGTAAAQYAADNGIACITE